MDVVENSPQYVSPPLRFGVVGCGRVAPTHFDAIQALGEKGSLVAVCDNDPNALARAVEKTGATGYASLREMLEQAELDIVSICTFSGLHAEHGIAAAKAGKHVVVEKPMDVSLKAAHRLIEACGENGVHLFPIFQNRFNTTVRLAKEAIEKGRLGKIYAVNGTMIWKRTQEYYDSADWRGTQAMDGGAFMNQGIHFVDAMRYLGGEITDVTSTLGTLDRDIGCEDIGSALFRFANGALGNIFCTTLGRYDQEGSLMILGEKGQIKLGGGCLNKIDIWDFDESDPAMDANATDADYQSQSVYGHGHQAFYNRIANNEAFTSGHDALETLRVLTEIYSGDPSG